MDVHGGRHHPATLTRLPVTIVIFHLATCGIAVGPTIPKGIPDSMRDSAEYALPGQYPYIVSLQRYQPSNKVWSHMCNGVILNPLWVLTAGSCLDGQDPRLWRVAFSKYNLVLEETGELYIRPKVFHIKTLSANLLHESHDAGLVMLTELVDLKGSTHRSACVPKPGFNVYLATVSRVCRVAGWGEVAKDGLDGDEAMRMSTFGDVLRQVSMRVLPKEWCKAFLGYPQFKHLIMRFCVNRANASLLIQFTPKDFGAPVICGIQKKPVVVGVMGNDTLFSPRQPIFTNVSKVFEWIAGIITTHSKPSSGAFLSCDEW